MSKEENKLTSDLQKMIRIANQRLSRIEKTYGEKSWASIKSQEKLDTSKVASWTEGGRIKIPKNATELQKSVIEKYVSNFLNSQTSTLRGIKAQQKQVTSTFRKRFGVERDLTQQEANALYKILGDEKYSKTVESIGSSQMLALSGYAIEKGYSKKKFIEMFDIADEDLKNSLQNLYDEYIR